MNDCQTLRGSTESRETGTESNDLSHRCLPVGRKFASRAGSHLFALTSLSTDTRYVLVHPKEIRGIVLLLDRAQANEVRTERSLGLIMGVERRQKVCSGCIRP